MIVLLLCTINGNKIFKRDREGGPFVQFHSFLHCTSGTYAFINRTFSWKTDPRGFFSGRLPRTT